MVWAPPPSASTCLPPGSSPNPCADTTCLIKSLAPSPAGRSHGWPPGPPSLGDLSHLINVNSGVVQNRPFPARPSSKTEGRVTGAPAAASTHALGPPETRILSQPCPREHAARGGTVHMPGAGEEGRANHVPVRSHCDP